MINTRPNPKHWGTNVIIYEVYVGGDYLTIQYALNITPSCHHNVQMRPIEMIKETEKQLKKSTCDMVNENFIRNLYRRNSSSPLSVGEIDKDEFFEALNRLINKFGLQTFICLPNA